MVSTTIKQLQFINALTRTMVFEDACREAGILLSIMDLWLADADFCLRVLTAVLNGHRCMYDDRQTVRVIPRFNPWSPELTAEIEAGRVAWGP